MSNDSIPIRDIHDARYVYLKDRLSKMDDTIHDLKEDVKRSKIIMLLLSIAALASLFK